jgi:hypothetical protein
MADDSLFGGIIDSVGGMYDNTLSTAYGSTGGDVFGAGYTGDQALGSGTPSVPGSLGYSLTGDGGYNLPAGSSGITSDTGSLFGATSGTGTGSGMSLQQLMQLLGQGANVATGLNGLSQARQIQGQAAAADPLAPYRAGFAAKLNGLVNDPSSITSMPGYDAGLQAVQRSQAAQGFTGSGNAQNALAMFGGNRYDSAVQQLAGLAGGIPGGGLAATQSGINLTNASLNRISSGIASMGT